MIGSLRARLLSWPAAVVLAGLVLLAVLVVPRLSGDADAQTEADRSFAKVCRDHGGTPSFAPGSGDYVKDARSCTIEYAGASYEMYAVHPEGFSATEAAAARRSCTLLARQRRRDAERSADGSGSRRVVWHPRSAICESQP